MSILSLPISVANEETLELNAVLILSQPGMTRKNLLVGAEELAQNAQGLTSTATRWRTQLSPSDRLTFAHLTTTEAALRSFAAWIPSDSKAAQALAYTTEHPEYRPLIVALFQIDALLDKRVLLRSGTNLFASNTAKEAMVILASERILKNAAYAAVGHAAKELAKSGLSLPSATPEFTVSLLAAKVNTLLNSEVPSLPAPDPHETPDPHD